MPESELRHLNNKPFVYTAETEPIFQLETVLDTQYDNRLTKREADRHTEVDKPDWKTKAQCVQPDATLIRYFFAPEGERKADKIERVLMAKQLCGMCAVRKECLNAALRNNEQYGIWGGLDEDERKASKNAGQSRKRKSA